MLSGNKLAGGVKAGLGLREWGWHSRQRNKAQTKEQGGEGNVTCSRVSLELKLKAAEGTKEERGQGPGLPGW